MLTCLRFWEVQGARVVDLDWVYACPCGVPGFKPKWRSSDPPTWEQLREAERLRIRLGWAQQEDGRWVPPCCTVDDWGPWYALCEQRAALVPRPWAAKPQDFKDYEEFHMSGPGRLVPLWVEEVRACSLDKVHEPRPEVVEARA